MEQAIARQQEQDGVTPNPRRFFCDEGELIYSKDSTYAFSKMWGTKTEEALETLVETLHQHDISYQVHEEI